MNGKKITLLILCGAFAGFVNGFLGTGGGIVAVSALGSVLKLHQKNANATALLVVLPLSVLSAVVYYFQGNVNADVVLPVMLGVTAGGVVGALLLSKMNGKWVKLLFALVMIAGGVKMFF